MKYNTKLASMVMIASMFAGTAHAATLYSNLSLGSSGSQVTDLQIFLATDASIYPEGLVTGYFGGLTRAAVLRYQAANGISQTGTVGPISRASINSGMGNGNSSYDSDAPIISGNNVSVGKNTATVNWATSEAATGRVYYSTTWPFYYATALKSSDGSFNATHSLTLAGLNSNTTYHFAKESVDASGNVMWTTHKTFSTTQ